MKRESSASASSGNRAGRGGQTPEGNAAAGNRAAGTEETRDRWAFLARASRELVDSLDYEATLETVAALSLPQLGSWSIVDLMEADGSMRRLTVVHPDAEQQDLARRLKDGWPPNRTDPLGLPVVARTGRSQLLSHVDDALLREVARSDENLRTLRALGITSILTVPLAARGRILGAMTFVSSKHDRSFSEADVSLAEDLAHRCALAIDNARLYHAARNLAAAHDARVRAEEASRLKTDFLATVSHELRTPLNVMSGYLELLAMEVAGPLNAAQRKYLHGVREGGQHLLRIVEDMLNLVRLQEHEIRYDIVEVPLHRVVANASESYRAALEGKGLTFKVSCDDSITARADPAKVWQILTNLLSNARKFTAHGDTVSIDCIRSGSHAEIRVHDSGCGIPPGSLEAIFEPFVQADSGLTRRAGGMGLGLSISRQLARAMEGDLTVVSPPGRGCTFTVTLPMVDSSVT